MNIALLRYPHINMWRPKRVVILEDAPEMYQQDPDWQHLPEPDKNFGIRCLEAARGRQGIVQTASQMGETIWYEVLFRPPVEVENVLGRRQIFPYLHITANYVRITESGYMEAC
jgi:hypothetical protein